jgi:LPXTG-motif cell wall-anchored protein
VNRTISGAAGAAFLAMLMSVSTVAAHAELVSSDPADGETIETPFTLTATFSEEFASDTERSFIRVQDAGGDIVASGGQSPDDATMMTVELPALEPGEYTVRWQTTTEDDNGVERGTFTFNVAAAATAAPTATPIPTRTTGASTPPVATQTPGVTPTPIPTPNGSGGTSTGSSNDVLLALAIGVLIVGVIAFFLVRRSRT